MGTGASTTRAAITMASAGLLALTACGPDEELEPETEPAETSPAETEQEEGLGEAENAEEADDDGGTEATDDEGSAQDGPGSGPPAGGTERLSEEDLDPEVHGEEAETHFSEEGAEVGVAGLSEDDSPLEVYAEPAAEPAAEAEMVGELEATDAVLLAGRERQQEDGRIWTEIELADGVGWVTTGSLYFFGQTEDVTEELIEEVPPAEDPEAVAESVGERTVEPWQEEGALPDAGDSVLISVPEDFGEEFHRVDATGMPDDSTGGYRLFVTLQEAGDGYELVQVERTALCQRGVGEDGLCL